MDTKKTDQLAQALMAAMPAPRPRRTCKMLIVFTPEERARLDAMAKEQETPPATLARNLILAALEAIGK